MRLALAFAAALAPLAVWGFALKPRSMDDQTPVMTMQGWDWTDCGLPSDPVHVKSIKLSPDPPQPGQDLTVTASGTVDETIEWGAYADVTVKIGLIKLLEKQFDVCQEAENNNVTIHCPVEKDDYTLVQTVALPKEIPRAKFLIQVRGYTKDEEPMICLNLKIDFMKPFFKQLGF